jgi:hypothetical protein
VIEIYFFAVFVLIVAGAGIGVLGMVCLGIRRDDRPGGFPADTSDGIARAARKMTSAGAVAPNWPG